ncbi:MAG: glycosyl hydrolase [Flavobacteriaceae bacterium]|nr:glycosyl hydrolase [Flavobacteriaceae bacterium]
MKNLSIFFVFLTVIPFSYSQDIEEKLEEVKYRNIGPFRGGRSVSSVGVINDPLTYYMGTVGGGLWKTTNAGSEWFNISDDYFKTSSVGAIAVSESDSRIIYVGMGEHAPRGVTTSYGDGIYKSTDAGETWEHIGLENTQQISRIIIHPDNPNIVYIAAQGAINGPTKERGIYKSTDGGKSWKNVLFVNELSGASELSIDYNNPKVLYATIWEHQRLPWKVISGGEGSGVYKSTDGGDNWFKIENGLPNELGKLAISVSRANSDKVYLLAESDSDKRLGGLFMSNNAGESWSRVSKYAELTSRAWYYIEVFADPNDENTVYVLSARTFRSIDGGKTWERISSGHGDYHDLWINPKNSKNMIISDDGGGEITFDNGNSWSSINIMPTAQFYRVNVDNLFPYNLYGGQQDNSTVKIASIGSRGGISQSDWSASAGGESAFLAFDPDDPQLVMGGSYLGSVNIYDTKAKARKKVMIEPINYIGKASRDMKYRFNWNAPIIWSQHESNTFYHAAQHLFKTKDFGKSWEVVSPDLTMDEDEKQGNGGGPYTNEAVGAENYGTISYVIESPHEPNTIYTGSDDGLVHLTKDGGKTWKNITPRGLPETIINAIDISPHDKETVYIATTRYKFNDKSPGLYKSTNYGESWKEITGNIPYGAYTRVVREDEVRKGLLLAGTELGVYISFNDGKSWERFNLNMPILAVTDLMIKHDDLIVATQGRSFWILDDMGLIRQMDDTKETRLFNPENSTIGNWYSQLNSNYSDGTSTFTGVNPANGVVIYYNLNEGDHDQKLTVKIYDENNKLIREINNQTNKNFISYNGGPSREPVLTNNIGLNRFVWNTRHKSLIGVPYAYIEGRFSGHKAIPGKYKISLEVGEKSYTSNFEILKNPNFNVSDIDYAEFDKYTSHMEKKFNKMAEYINNNISSINKLTEVIKNIKDNEDVKNNGKSLLSKMDAWDKKMMQRKSLAYDDVENFPNKFLADYLFILDEIKGDIPNVSKGILKSLKDLDDSWESLKKEIDQIIDTDLPDLNSKLWKIGIGAIN